MNQIILQSDSPDMQKIGQRLSAVGLTDDQIQKELSFAIQIISESPKLKECTVDSIINAVGMVGSVGLTLNPAAKETYLIPQWNKRERVNQAALMPSYIGLAKLIISEGHVTAITTQIVYENDRIEIDMANNVNPVRHFMELNAKKRGDIIGCYSLATLKDGTRQVEYMDIETALKIRSGSESWKNENTRNYSPWEKWFEEMFRKSTLKRLTKYLPRGEGQAREMIDRAIAIDNRDAAASFQQISYIGDLLRTTSLDPQRSRDIDARLNQLSAFEADQIIAELKDAQAEPRDPAKQFIARNADEASAYKIKDNKDHAAALERIAETMAFFRLDGSKETMKIKKDLIQLIFGTTSKSKIDQMSTSDLKSRADFLDQVKNDFIEYVDRCSDEGVEPDPDYIIDIAKKVA